MHVYIMFSLLLDKHSIYFMTISKRDVFESNMPPLLGSLGRKWMESENNWDFSTSKGHNSVKIWSIVPNIKLDLDIYMLNHYTKLHFSLCYFCEKSERKVQIFGSFRPRGITLSKIVWSHTLMISLYT